MDLLTRLLARFRALPAPLQVAVVAALAFAVYVPTRRAANPYNQYVLLTDAFLHGRLDLVHPPPYLELARVHGRSYVIDPPAPTLFLLPVVAVAGAGADHVLVSCGVGALAVGLVWFASTRLWPDARLALAATVLVAFGTDFWWVASDGGFWSFAHVSAVFFSAAGLVAVTGRPSGGGRGAVSGLFVGLAGLSRLPTFLLAPLFAFLLVEGRRVRDAARALGAFALTWGGCGLLYPLYNLARYGTVRDLGYWNERYLKEPWFSRGRFDITYVPRHIRAILYEWPARVHHFPYFVPRYVGTALVLTTPAFLYALRARRGPRTGAALLALGLVSIPLLTHGAVGFSQFGYRFSLDMFPPLLVLTVAGLRGRVSRLALSLLALSVLVNLWGVLAFNVFGWATT